MKKGIPNYENTMKYWRKKQDYKKCWDKISNIHKELIHQISTRIVEYVKHSNVDSIRFEDLRWSKHIPRERGGFYLATWQIHWFLVK